MRRKIRINFVFNSMQAPNSSKINAFSFIQQSTKLKCGEKYTSLTIKTSAFRRGTKTAPMVRFPHNGNPFSFRPRGKLQISRVLQILQSANVLP